MNDVYTERAILELISWAVPAVLALLALVLKGPRTWLAGIPARIRRANAERRADKHLHRTMAREWPAFSQDMTSQVTDLRDNNSRITRKIHAIRDDLSGQLGNVSKVLGTLLAMTLSDFDTSPDPRFLCDADGRITHINSAMASELGLDKEELMEWRWRGRVPADMLLPFLERFAAANAGHYQLDDEIQMRHRDRRLVRFRILLMPFPPDEKPATHWAAKLTRLDVQA